MLSSLSTIVHHSRTINAPYSLLLTITNSGADLTQFQVTFLLPYNNLLDPDFAFLIFRDTNNNDIPFWIEEYTSGICATVWLKIPNLTSTFNVKVFRSTSSVVNRGDPNNVFELYDDFTSLDGSKWIFNYGTDFEISQLYGLKCKGPYLQGRNCTTTKTDYDKDITLQAALACTGNSLPEIVVRGSIKIRVDTRTTNHKMGVFLSFLDNSFLMPDVGVSPYPSSSEPPTKFHVLTLKAIGSNFYSYYDKNLLKTYSDTNPLYNNKGSIALVSSRINGGFDYYKWVRAFKSTNNVISMSYNWINRALENLNNDTSMKFYFKFLSSDNQTGTNRYKNYAVTATNTYDLELTDTSKASISDTTYYKSTSGTSLYLNNTYAKILSTFTFTPGNGFTVVSWIRNNNASNSNARLVFFGKNAATFPITELVLVSPDITFNINNTSLNHNYSTGYLFSVNNDTWTHIAWVIEPSSTSPYTYTLYINGEIVNTITSQYFPQNIPRDLIYIGCGINGINPFNGYLNEFRVYDRSLNKAEIQVLYNA